jgi:hypothetical protein
MFSYWKLVASSIQESEGCSGVPMDQGQRLLISDPYILPPDQDESRYRHPVNKQRFVNGIPMGVLSHGPQESAICLRLFGCP